MTTQTKLIKLAILLILAAAIITACGDNPDTDNTQNPPANNPITLTILAQDWYTNLIRSVESDMRTQFAEQGINFRIELTDYSTENFMHYRHNETLQIMLMAGEGYDIVFLNYDSLNIRSFADNGFLLNVYDLIDQDPNLTRDDFFTNVFAAMEHRGGLYSFPFSFGFDFVGINASLPDSFLNDFSQKSQISLLEIMNLLNRLKSEYPEIYASFPHTSNIQALHFHTVALISVLSDFIDFDNSVSHFNSAEFMNLITVLQNTVPITHSETFDSRNVFSVFGSVADMNRMAEQNILLGVTGISRVAGFDQFSELTPFFPTKNEQFLNFIPIADNNGKLLLDTEPVLSNTFATVIFPVLGDGIVAWDFTQQLLHRMLSTTSFMLSRAGHFGSFTFVIPILRDELEPQFNRVMQEVENTGNQFNFGTQAEIAANRAAALAKITELANSPVSVIDGSSATLFWSGDLFNSFMLGVITAEDLAQEVHNRASLWLLGG
ncbi:MAG: hypothetical protein FWG68_03920 [Defluviitaleaceae bacterium]|nr:hypothetical protein [Defluviitaleaceae bacterium]